MSPNSLQLSLCKCGQNLTCSLCPHRQTPSLCWTDSPEASDLKDKLIDCPTIDFGSSLSCSMDSDTENLVRHLSSLSTASRSKSEVL